MKLPAAALSAALAVCTLSAAPAFADEALAKAKNCTGCHVLDQKRVGPAFKDIAARYAKQPGAVDKLVGKVLNGSVCEWSVVPMPPNKYHVNESEARELVQWILGTNPDGSGWAKAGTPVGCSPKLN
ncbi:c-type cytochrome [Azoarcus sp. TTM-91]|uniref:c-type cytochrome n=1 Tax=Azoarcus sp. TTM-91 TaxID=2691581 RepID=UPI0032B87CD4